MDKISIVIGCVGLAVCLAALTGNLYITCKVERLPFGTYQEGK